jgi:AcrR family transcriptional regulator
MIPTARRRLTPEVRRREIIEAAEKLLRRLGPEVRVEDVVREAGAAKGTFFVYFPAWDDLLDEIRRRAIEQFDQAHPLRLEAVPKREWPMVLERLAVAFVDAMIAMGRLHTVLFHTDFAMRRPIPDADNPINRLISVIRAGRKAGAFSDVDVQLTGRLLFAVIHEAAEAIAGGQKRASVFAAMRPILRKALAPGM